MPALANGTSLGPYQIVAPLGAGGMGEVYRATDTRLKRQVAIKVMPSILAADPERLGRFQREAEVLASLNHPHIAAIYGFEDSNGVKALVMELVDGATLADRIAQGPIPIDEALPIARQIAEALEAAHERGIIHRDLKPANIKVRDDGKVKVLDFGLAKLTEAPGATSVISADDASQAATVMSPATMTGMGMILGTAAYMSPEQARGKTVDKRTDVWAFGAVLYEMLTGQRAFAGDDIADTIASVMKTTPDWAALPADVPPHVVTLIQRCLDKDRHARIGDIAVARFLLSDHAPISGSGISRVMGVAPSTISASSSAATPAVTSAAPLRASAAGRSWRALAPIAIAGLVAGGVIGWLLPRGSTVAAPVTALDMNVRPADALVWSAASVRPSRTAMALSPDGRLVVFAAAKGNTMQLYARAFDKPEATPIAGTEGAMEPFFSPDGAWIGFRAENRLKKVPTAGGASAVICDLPPAGFGPGKSWTDDGTIYFSGNDGLFKVSAAGGAPERILENQGGGERVLLPYVLPGGTSMLYTVVTGDQWDAAKIVIHPLDKVSQPAARRVLIDGGADARYVETGHLVYVRSGTLMGVPFNLASQQVTGTPVPMIENVMQGVNAPSFGDETGAGQFALSRSGTLLYARGGIAPLRKQTMWWVDRTGAAQPLNAPELPQLDPRLSPDGRKIAANVRRGTSRTTDVWIYDVVRGAPTRLTLSMDSRDAVWSPDSTRIAFVSTGGGNALSMFVTQADGSGQPELLVKTNGGSMNPATWSPGANAIAYLHRPPGGIPTIWVLPMDGTPRTPRKFLESDYNLADPEFSPDGKWIAYVSHESGGPEVYVQPYPGPGQKIRLSTLVGFEPVWVRHGREIVYRSVNQPGEHSFFSAAITSLAPFTFDTPRLLFKAKATDYDSTVPTRAYDATADGQRLLMMKLVPTNDKPVSEMHVVLNWTDELTRRVATK